MNELGPLGPGVLILLLLLLLGIIIISERIGWGVNSLGGINGEVLERLRRESDVVVRRESRRKGAEREATKAVQGGVRAEERKWSGEEQDEPGCAAHY